MKKLLFFVTILMLVLSACNSDDASKEKGSSKDSSDKLSIYTTVYPLQYFAERIGGDAVQVASIYPAGANEHTFEPTQKDMMTLADADLFFYVGLGLEGFVENAKKTLAKEDVKLVAVAKDVTEEQLDISTGHTHAEGVEEHDHDHDHEDETHEDHDAHVWLSPIISQQLALAIKDELVRALPEQEETFTANYDQLESDQQEHLSIELDATWMSPQQAIDTGIPTAMKKLISAIQL